MLKTLPFLDGVVDSAYFVTVMEEMMQFEEQGMLLAPLQGS